MTAPGDRSTRAGRYIRQPAGYRAFVPAPLPPDPPLRVDEAVLGLLSRADQALGRLDGVARMLPDPDLFVGMYVRREAVLSSQIEGTRSTLDDVLTHELDPRRAELPADIVEVTNYIRAINHGIERMASLPLSLRLIREIHAVLLGGVSGPDRTPGEFRRSQNWIGPANAPLARASFVPPALPDMHAALDNLEKFVHADTERPVLIDCALVHAQFEMIHPFLDGNGRVGRLLIALLLVHHGVLRRPLLYLSLYLRRYQGEYYDRLAALQDGGDWEGWVRFFLRGVVETARAAAATAEAIVALREAHSAVLDDAKLGRTAPRLLDLLFRRPFLSAPAAADALAVSSPTARQLLERFEELAIVEEVTGGKRNRRYRYTPYLALFENESGEP